MTRLAAALALMLLASTAPAGAECYRWPLRDPPNYDGDSIYILLPELPPELREISVRVRGVDTPEISRPQCEAERQWGARSTRFTRDDLTDAEDVAFCDPEWDRYGRIVATVLVDGANLATSLITAGLGRDCGERRCESWCE